MRLPRHKPFKTAAECSFTAISDFDPDNSMLSISAQLRSFSAPSSQVVPSPAERLAVAASLKSRRGIAERKGRGIATHELNLY
jgi:hypothetical protein